MPSTGALRVSFIVTILILVSFATVPNVAGQSTGGETVLYFKNMLSYEDFNESEQFDAFFGLFPIPPLSESPPTKENDSRYPPRAWKNADEFFLYMGTAWLFYLYPEFNLSELFEEFGGMDLEGYDLELLFPHPYRVVGGYTYEGEETIEISDDISFSLYFDSHLRILPKFRDQVKVSLYSLDAESLLPLPKHIKNTTVEIKPRVTIKRQQITLENVNLTLEPGKSILLSVEIIPGENIIGSREWPRLRNWSEQRLNKLKGRIEDFIERNINRSDRPFRYKLADLFNNIIYNIDVINELFEGTNLTRDDIIEMITALNIMTSAFVYDSASHPSSVSVPFTVPGDENTKVYYLHADNVMNEDAPSNTVKNDRLSTTPITWEGPTLPRSKILKSATANLYLDPFLLKKTVTVRLYNGDNEIAFDSQEVRGFFPLKPKEPVTFSFDSIDREIFYDTDLVLGVSLGNGTKIQGKVEILYDSDDYPSVLIAQFEETDNIQFDYTADPENELIVPGDEVKYTLNITSEKADDITIDIIEDAAGDWTVTIEETLPISMTAGSTTDVNVTVKSNGQTSEVYGDTIDLTFEVSGKTGFARKKAFAEVSEEAIDYDVNIVGYTESKNIKKGGSGIFYFIIENNNTGAIDDVDSYIITATSKNEWDLEYSKSITDLMRGDKTGSEEILVHVSVPKNTTLDSDTITFTVTSDSNSEAFATVNVTVKVTGADILESIKEFLKSLAESLGLDDIFGDYAPVVLLAIPIIIVLVIIALLVFVLRRKFVNIICTDRIRQIDPDEGTKFEITLQNPTRKTQTYLLSFNSNPSTHKWLTSIEPDRVTVESKKSKTVLLSIRPTEVIEPKDWTETKLKVNRDGKKRTVDISLMVMVREGKPILQIKNVFSWPKDFITGDRVVTSFRVENKGSISARNAKIILYINGRQKNKVEVTIPSGGFADIKMPWIAVKGKNKLLIKTVE